jgi:ribosomal protein S6E (S10)
LQLNIANAGAAAMKVYSVDDEKKLAHVYGLRIGQVRHCAGGGRRGVATARDANGAAPPSRGGDASRAAPPAVSRSPPTAPACTLPRSSAADASLFAAAQPAHPRSRATRHATTRRAQEVEGDNLDAEQFKGYIFRVTGGNDKQGFPMQQGILSSGRVRLLMGEGSPYFRVRRAGERRRKSIRGCIVAQDIAILNLVIVKHGEAVLPGLTDEAANRPNRLGPKRASKIRKVFNLSKEDDVRKKVITRTFTTKKGKIRVLSGVPLAVIGSKGSCTTFP